MTEETPTGRPTVVKPPRPEPMQAQLSVKKKVAKLQDDLAKAKAITIEAGKE